MENLNLALVSSSKPLMLGRVLARDATDRDVLRRKPFSLGRVFIAPHRCRYRVSALSSSHHGQKSDRFLVPVCNFRNYSQIKIEKSLHTCVSSFVPKSRALFSLFCHCSHELSSRGCVPQKGKGQLSSRLKVNVTLCIDIDGSLYEFEYNSARCNKVV
ncbi:hypothetical protein DEO72_LG1g1578 [Vigna unguiculata]|uniref:Uncharacterized protein n=1 Tax=Vigna unguiculata TaxID=3917 RepID=A0A4D6KMN7_VIGUN|nr:hypothetical protein DEO72_LG1g1578 [Vigna unguiculata]